MSLSNRISDYQRRTGNATAVASTHMGATASPFGDPLETYTVPAAPHAPHTDVAQFPHTNQDIQAYHDPGLVNLHGQQASFPGGTSSTTAYTPGMNPSSHTPQQRSAAMQRGSYLIQELGLDLYQHHVASGVVSAAAADVTQSPAPQNYAASSNAFHAPQAQMTSSMSQSVSPQLGGQINYGAPTSPLNIFHRNLNQATAARDTQSVYRAGHRSFSTGSVPISTLPNQPAGSSPMPPSSSTFRPPTTARVDYENMRRSFSSTTDLTPQTLPMSPQRTPNLEPLKRSMPPASPTNARKRARVSLPGEDEAPTLTPSSSIYQLYAPAGLPAQHNVDFVAEVAAIEQFEKQNMADLAALDGAQNVGLQQYQEQYQVQNVTIPATQGTSPSDVYLYAHVNIPVDPQLYENTNVSLVEKLTEDNLIHHGDAATEQAGAELPQAASTATQDPNDTSSPLSEPDWSFLNEDMFLGH